MSASLPRRAVPFLSSLSVVAAIAAVAAIVGALRAGPGADPWHLVHWLAKPLATLALLLLAWRSTGPASPGYRRRICAGLALALLGDVLLMLPGDLFVPGLVAFLLAHLCFLAAWLDDSRPAAQPGGLLLCLVAALLLVVRLWSGLASPLRPAVAVYALVLATMAGQALGRARQHALARDRLAPGARLAAIGAVLFMLSDSLLAWDRFATALPWAPLWILGTYYPALWCIARSVGYPAAAPARATT